MTQTLRYFTFLKERPNFVDTDLMFSRGLLTLTLETLKNSITDILFEEFSKIFCTKLIFKEVHFNCNLHIK